MNAAKQLVQRLSNAFNAVLPAEKRDAVRDVLQDFAYVYPKLAVFLLLNVLLTGIPLLCFTGFAVTVFVSSLIAALFGAVIATLLITAFAIFTASLLLLPTIFLTTLSACSLYFWGLTAYYIFVYLQSAGSDTAIQSTDAVPSGNDEWEDVEHGECGDTIPSTGVFASDNATPSADAISAHDATQAMDVVLSDNAIEGEVQDWSAGGVTWTPRTDAKSIDRPKVEANDSAVGLEGLKEKSVQRPEAMASEFREESDVGPHMSSLAESIRSEIASTATSSTTPKSPMSRRSSQSSMPSTASASTEGGQPVYYAKLRKEHPDGLRQDSKGLFKVDEIASDSSLEEADRKQRPDGNRPLRKRSASAFTSLLHDPITAVHGLKREQTAIHLPMNTENGKLNPPARISPIRLLSTPELKRSLDQTKVKTAMLKEGVHPATGNPIFAPVDPNAAHADVEDNCDSDPSSGKSSGEIERIAEDSASADEMDFANMPPTPEDERGPSVKSSISPYTGEIVESYFGDMGLETRI